MSNIFLMIGPSHCGKSVLSDRLSKELNGIILSSDDIRRKLLCNNTMDKMDDRMMTVSKQAFDLLFANLEAHCSYPVNTPNIVVDTTGLDERFRARVCEIAKANQYAVHALCFIFDNKEEYFQYCDSSIQHSVTRKHVDKLFKKEAAKLPSKNFTTKTVFRSREKLNNWNVDSVLSTSQAHYKVLEDRNYIVVGDIHGCYEEFIEVLKRNDGRHFIFVGDIVDKGDRVAECVHHVVRLIKDGQAYCLRGNHENFILQYWKGKVDIDDSFVREHFQCALIQDPIFRNKVQELWDLSYDWIEGPGFVITHSPCERKYLQKHDRYSIKAQRNLRHAGLDTQALLSFLYKEDNACFPLHVFGHVALDKVYKGKSWCALDSGCVHGGKLSYIDLTNRYIGSVRAIESRKKDDLPSLEKEVDMRITDLENPRDRGRAYSIVENRVNFLSGTMSPADKLDGDLESLEWALNYYKQNGQKNVVLQKKMMGSRCQVYLFPELSDCYAVSRNGYVIGDRVDMSEIFGSLINKFRHDFDNGLKLRILDGELMPWSALGRDLIDRSFYGFYELASLNFDALCNSGFFDAIEKTKQSLSSDFGKLTKQEFIDKHKHHIYKMHEGYHKVNKELVSKDDMQRGLQTFLENVDRYGSDTLTSYYPFYILKDVYQDREIVYGDGTDNFRMFCDINNDDIVCCPVDNIECARETFEFWSYKNGYEGVVVKPEFVDSKIAPYLKVRNKDYLTITYGPDYQSPNKMEKLLRKKNINTKLRASIEDWKLGQQMLSIPYNEIETSKQFESLVARFIGSEPKDMDPRL